MAWPSGTVPTTNVDAGTDSPSAARADIKQAIEAVNTMVGARGQTDGIASTDSTGKVPTAQGGIPSGAIMDYAGATEPTGWLFCAGQAISRTTYANLFAAIGTNYGAGDGSTTFNVPDYRGRVSAGRDDMGGTNAQRLTVVLNGTTTAGSAVITGLSSTAGLSVGMSVIGSTIPAGRTIASIDSATQVTLNSGTSVTAGTATSLRFALVDGITLGAAGGDDVHTLTTPQMPSHTHTLTNVTTTSSVGAGATTGILNTYGSGYNTTATGGGQAHPNVQPTLICNKIIKT